MNHQFFNKRRTIRKYLSKDISESLLNEMIEAASHAPTTGNMQLYSVVCTRSYKLKERLSPPHFNQPMITEAPVVLTFCADLNRFNKWCVESNAAPGFDNFQSLLSAILDVTIFAQQFVTIAEIKGLGCCYLGTTTYNAKQISSILELPKRVIPITTITLGWPENSDSSTPSDRLPLKGIIHSEKYHDYTSDDIKDIYEAKESLDVNMEYVKENSKDSLAQVFTDIRYPKNNNEYFSKEFYQFIKEQLFTFPE